MQILRAWMAIFIFFAGMYFIYSGFNLFSILCGIACFVVASFCWPSKVRSDIARENTFLDALEFMIELPIEIFLWLLRVLGRIFKGMAD